MEKETFRSRFGASLRTLPSSKAKIYIEFRTLLYVFDPPCAISIYLCVLYPVLCTLSFDTMCQRSAYALVYCIVTRKRHTLTLTTQTFSSRSRPNKSLN